MFMGSSMTKKGKSVTDLQIKVKWQNEGFPKLSQKKNRHDKQTAEAA